MTRNRERIFSVVLALLATYYLLWPLYRAFFPLEILPNEGWNAYFQDAAAEGRSVYPPREAFILNNYPPLSFYVVGWLGAHAGDALYVGRALSIAALAGLSIAVAFIIRQLGCGGTAAAVGSFWFLAVMGQGFHRFIGANEPQLVAECIMGFALAWFLARNRKGEAVELPILLMVLGGFWKHNVVVVPLLALTWLWLRNPAKCVRPILIGGGAAMAGLAVCIIIHGQPFLANLLLPRHYSWFKILSGVGKLQWIAPALVVWATWAWQSRTCASARFTALYIFIALTTYLIQFGGDGVVDNAQFDLVLASAVSLGVAYEHFGATTIAKRFGAGPSKLAIATVLLLRLVANVRYESASILLSQDYRDQFRANARFVQEEIKTVAAIPGPVGCRNKLICRMAGQPFVADDFKIRQLLPENKLSEEAMELLLAGRGISYFRNDARTSAESLTRDLFRP